MKEFLRVVKFTLFSISAGLVQILVFTLLKKTTGMVDWSCHLIALICSVIWNFTLNRKYTFQSSNNVPVAMFKVFVFYLIFTPFSTWFVKYFTDTVGWNGYLVEGLIMLINFITEFLYQRFYVFKGSIDTAPTKY